MSDSDDKIASPKRISETGTKGVVLERINKRSNLKLVGKVENLLGKEFKNLEDSFLAPVIKMGRRQKNMAFVLNRLRLLGKIIKRMKLQAL